MGIATLKKRSEFQRVRGGGRWSTPAFLMEGKPRAVQTATAAAESKAHRSDRAGHIAHFGFTVTKKLGGAVVRNRIRRRLRAAVSEVAVTCAEVAYDYVIIARQPAVDRSFALLKSDFQAAFKHVHAGPRRTGKTSDQGGRS